MNKEYKLMTVSGLSMIWDGQAIRRVRAGDGAVTLPGRRLAMHLQVQPEVSDILFADRLLMAQGFLSRTLCTTPPESSGTRLWRPEQESTERDLDRYGARVLTILERPMPLAAQKSNELEPRPLPLSPAAQSSFIRFYNQVELDLRTGGDLESIRGFGNKLAEHAARLAAVLALVDDPDSVEIDKTHLEAGIVLAEYYTTEALRLFGVSHANADIGLAQKLLAWLHTQWSHPLVSLPDIYRCGPYAIRDQQMAKKIASVLEDHGELIKKPGGAIVAGVRRRDVWSVVRWRAAP
jgi:hypothetical protein